MKERKKIGLKGVAIAAIMLTALFCSIVGYAEGSKELTQYGGYRPYLEWDANAYTSGIERINTMQVFAYEGETISLGSSVLAAADGKDIVLKTPSGEEIVFDVTAETGYIDTRAKELNGPYPEKGGYTPITYSVQQTGVYEVGFHAYERGKDMNPEAVNVDTIYTTQKNTKGYYQAETVAAWDVTVKNSAGAAINGRLYTKYVALNAGKNILGTEVIKSHIYVLTKDGYQYDVNLNGIDPFGFMFFANNRGLIDATNNTTLYGSGVSKDNNLNLFGNVKVQSPIAEDTATNITHRLFFNIPSNDLPASIPTQPVGMAKVLDFEFEGFEKGIASEENGGAFHVTVDKSTTYQIMLDINNNGVFDEGYDVILANAAAPGKNTISWDGNDATGAVVKEGTYSAYVMTKGGEYHFPLLDAENNLWGIKVELLNLSNTPDGFDPYKIYYNLSDYTTADGTVVSPKGSSKLVDRPDPMSALDGVNSENGAYSFTNAFGDYKALDFWTYVPGNEDNTTFKIVKEAVKVSTVKGVVFFDKNSNAIYDITEQPLANVPVKITDKDGKTYNLLTDRSGSYAQVVPQGAYTVEVNGFVEYVLTTANEKQAGNIVDKSEINIGDVGYYMPLDAGISISASKSELKIGDEVTFTITVANNMNVNIAHLLTDVALPANTIYITDSSDGAFDYLSGTWELEDLAAGESKSFTVTAQVTTAGQYTYPVKVTTEGDSVAENNTAVTGYTVEALPTPTPPPTIVLKNDFAYLFGRSETKMQADDTMRRGEAAAVLHRLLKQNDELGSFVYDISATPAFRDLAGRWDRSAIEFMTYLGIYDANPEKFIGIDGGISRGEAFKMFAISLDMTNDTTLTPEQYTQYLVDAGYVQGYEDGTMRLDNIITRAEFCKIYNIIIGRDSDHYKLITVDGDEVVPATYGFNDITDDWTYEIMLKATSAFDENGYVDINARGIRNNLDDYDGR